MAAACSLPQLSSSTAAPLPVLAAPRRSCSAPRRRCVALAAQAPELTQATIAPSRPAEQLGSNVVPVSPRELDGRSRKLELQAQARAALEADNSWWKDTAGAPANLVSAGSKAEFKALIMNAAANQLVVVDYLKPSCGACRRLFPKLHQVAAQNPDALFVKVNVDLSAEMRELGQGMGVTHLPWFHLFRGGQLLASFSANVTTVGTLRAEIAGHKACEDPACITN